MIDIGKLLLCSTFDRLDLKSPSSRPRIERRSPPTARHRSEPPHSGNPASFRRNSLGIPRAFLSLLTRLPLFVFHRMKHDLNQTSKQAKQQARTSRRRSGMCSMSSAQRRQQRSNKKQSSGATGSFSRGICFEVGSKRSGGRGGPLLCVSCPSWLAFWPRLTLRHL